MCLRVIPHRVAGLSRLAQLLQQRIIEYKEKGGSMKAANIIAGLAAAAVVFQGGAWVVQGSANPLRPPGSHGEGDFSSRCVKCGKCIEACPYQAIFSAGTNAGISAGSPCIDARRQACRLCEDLPCISVCPTAALRGITQRDDVRMGIAVIDEKLCIAYQGMRCEVCYRVCPLIDRAISIDYRLREGDDTHAIFAPIVNEELCAGCGLCVERCVISEPHMAIRIDPKT